MLEQAMLDCNEKPFSWFDIDNPFVNKAKKI
jgi:hypothetical protein